jgi:hypothetical protein
MRRGLDGLATLIQEHLASVTTGIWLGASKPSLFQGDRDLAEVGGELHSSFWSLQRDRDALLIP